MGVQPSIRPWGQSGNPAWWCPDIFVDNDGDRVPVVSGTFHYYDNVDEYGEPVKGEYNRLFAVVRNLGDIAATGVQVEFSYSPFGIVTGSTYQSLQFKTIATVSVDLEPVGLVGSEKEIEVQWDLSNLSENNGGIWLAPISYFDHYCVKVHLTHPMDTNTADNTAQHNFCNVISDSPISPIPILITNDSNKTANVEFVVHPVDSWKVGLRGSKETTLKTIKTKEREPVLLESLALKTKEREPVLLESFTLKRNEQQLVNLKVTPPAEFKGEFIDVSLRVDRKLVGGCSFRVKKGGIRLARILDRETRKLPVNVLPVSFRT
jgi:hypothetical protein